MLKSIFLLFISATLLTSCGGVVSESNSKSKYYLTMTKSGETIESDNCNYYGSGNKMKFEIGGKGELHIFDLYDKVEVSNVDTFQGQSFPAKVVWNLAEFEGEVKIEKMKEETGGNEHSTNFNIVGHFSGDKDTEVDFSVSMFKMK